MNSRRSESRSHVNIPKENIRRGSEDVKVDVSRIYMNFLRFFCCLGNYNFLLYSRNENVTRLAFWLKLPVTTVCFHYELCFYNLTEEAIVPLLRLNKIANRIL